MFAKILIANRGEIACRIARTARRMGVATVAVYSDADARALHVAEADEAVRIGPPAAAESYLMAESIIAAALSTGAEAVHPGYGFLSENPAFVEAVESAGLVFIGPSAASIRAMGLKDAAKRVMEKAGVPVVPGYHGDGQALVLLAGKAREIGYPVLIKARAGGGGRGMRRVDDPDDFAEALSAARREAKAVFGDDAVLVEKYVEKPRHIEVQVFGDGHGNVVHLFERDCSAQRRHQKVMEEAPAPGMDAVMRAAVTTAAIKAAQATGYVGAGTVEFIADASAGLQPDRFWFMEMNTRLQVEHPVTEMITGVDLVEWQLRVAAGEPLPMAQDAIGVNGHAVEARIYAEDPARGFLPATGTLHHLAFGEAGIAGAQTRVETGVRSGDAVSPFYDPMIAKLIVHAGDRTTALAGLKNALLGTRIAGSTTNTGFLAALAGYPDMVTGDVDTGMIGRAQHELTRLEPVGAASEALAAAASIPAGPRAWRHEPWSALSGYAHFAPLARTVSLGKDEDATPVRVAATEHGRYGVAVRGRSMTIGEEEILARAVAWPGHVTVFDAAATYTFVVPDPSIRPEEAGGADALRAPMPGLVKLVRAARGEAVAKGQPLLVLEAMKMEHAITAPHAGIIAEIAAEGSQVSDGTVLVRFAAD